MPRSGVNGTYTLPGAQNTQQPVTTIPSSVNNQGWSDIEQTFNTPQPLAYGGTGATSPVGAADAISTKGTDIASAGTTNIAGATGMFVHITGTTTITAFGTAPAGTRRDLVFDGSLTLTHNAVSLILPGGANILTGAGDTATAISEGSGNWRVVDYQRSATAPGISAGSVVNSWYAQNNTYFSGPAPVPVDDTPPTAAEGVTFLSVTTGVLKSTTNKLRMRFSGVIGADAVGAVIASILINGAPASRSAFSIIRVAGDVTPLACEYEYTPGSTASVTIIVNCGAQTGNLRANGTTARLFGGALGLALIVEEIQG